MSMYIVDGDLLIAIAEELRAKGEIADTVELPLVRKTSNAIDLNTTPTDSLNWEDPNDRHYVDRIYINGASSIQVKGRAKIPYNQQGGGYLKIGDYTYESSSASSQDFSGIEVVIPGDAVDIEWFTGFGGNYFYYLEFDGLDENGNRMVTFQDPMYGEDGKYTLAEMAAAVNRLRPFSQDVLHITSNGVYDVYEYGYADVKLNNTGTPTTYKEVIVTSHDNYTFDLSDYIVNENDIFTLGFTFESGSSGDGSKKYFFNAMYHHNPATKNEGLNIYGYATNTGMNNTSSVGITAFPSDKLTVGKAKFENGILSFSSKAGEARQVGTSAVLRYLA